MNFNQFQDLYEDVSYGVLSPSTKIKVKVNPSGVVILRANVHADQRSTVRFGQYATPATLRPTDSLITFQGFVPQSTARLPTGIPTFTTPRTHYNPFLQLRL